MKRLLIVAAILGAVVALFLVLWPPEPKYQGRTVTAWLDDWATNKQNGSYYEAIEHIGTNALPYAVHSLALNDSRGRSNYSRLWTTLPDRLKRLFPAPRPLLKVVDGANVFFYLGTNSIPQAIALLKHDSPTVRQAAALGLATIRRKSTAANQAIPALIEALADQDQEVRLYAALALKEMGADASNAVPALAKVVADTGIGPSTNSLFYLRAAAAVALGKIGPAASRALPVLKTALLESNSYLRGQTAVAIWRIDSDVDTALPVLLREMPGTVEDSKWDWIVALGEMGPRAKEAVPQLRRELQQDEYKWVLSYVTNALKLIDPQTATEAGGK
jgi:HEAT repeat protein